MQSQAPMRVVRARDMGFCFGVRDALEVALSVEDPHQTTVYGEIVHNDDVRRELAARGLRELPENGREAGPATSHLLITAHGVSERERARLEERGHRLIDTTCPLVRRAHDTARSLAARGCHVVVLGRPGHVEVRGLTGDLDSFSIVGRPEDVESWPHARLGVVCQTTLPPAEVDELTAEIRRRNPHAEILVEDTVCEPTRRRQQALRDLLEEVDAVVVVGGPGSHNTRQLAETCRAAGKRALQVSGPRELEASFFAGCRTVGLTAGTSTPDATIDAVEAALRAIAVSLAGQRRPS